MKLFFTLLLWVLTLTTIAQKKQKQPIPIKQIERVFNNYIKYNESVDTQENKDVFTKAVNEITFSSAFTELTLLINVWMYYDPTDFNTRTLIDPIFIKNKWASLKYINKRINNKKTWEKEDEAPFSDLINLKKKLEAL